MIEFPKPELEYFAESFVVRNGIVYFPLNSHTSNGAFYAYKRNKFKKLFDFQQGEVILGSKIHHHQLICVCGHQILICDWLTGENKKYINLCGIVPNDVCIVGNHVYCGGNVTTNPDCGVVLQICLTTHRQCIVIDKRSFVCGINALKNKLYVSSLNKIYGSQTKILQNGTNGRSCYFRVTLHGS